MKKIGIIRGLMPRMAQAEFAHSFTKLEPVFITGEADKEIQNYCRQNKLKLRNLKNKPIFIIDPLELITGTRWHQSWVGVEGLYEASRDLSYLQTYELYHFFSGQAAEIAQNYKIPLITEVWTSFLHPAYFFPPYSITVQKVIKNTSLFIARSYKAKKALLRLGIPDGKIKVIYHGINLKQFKPAKNMDSKYILYVGQLEAYKGVDMLLKVWPKINKIYPEAQLVLAGKGSLYKSAINSPSIKAVGYVTRKDLAKYYQKASLFISPSQNRYIGPLLWWEEFFSYTLMEAQASGLPIIATNSGGIPEEVGRNNWLIPQKNEFKLFETIIEALKDSNKLNLIGDENRQYAYKNYNIFTQTSMLEAEIKKI